MTMWNEATKLWPMDKVDTAPSVCKSHFIVMQPYLNSLLDWSQKHVRQPNAHMLEVMEIFPTLIWGGCHGCAHDAQLVKLFIFNTGSEVCFMYSAPD